MTCTVACVDAFTDTPYTGNPAVVCLLDTEVSDGRMQSIATEMNVSDTAFVHLHSRGPDGFKLRWFTPTTEVPLCGHATLASAHFLWEEGVVPRGDDIDFSTNSGRLSARRNASNIELDFPAEPVVPETPPDNLQAVLGTNAWRTVGKCRLGYLVELESEEIATAGKPPYTWTKVAGYLPGDVSLSPSGVLAGSGPRGLYTFQTQVMDSLGATSLGTFTLEIQQVTLH